MSAPHPPGSPPPPTLPPETDDAAPGEGTAPRRLTRHQEGRMVGGVATGLAAYLGIDVVVVRIAFVVLAFVPFPGFGALVYVAMLLLVPVAQGDAVVPASKLTHRGAGFWIGLVLIGLASFWFLGAGVAVAGSFGGPFGGGLFPLLLIGLGVALWVDADRRNGGRGRPAPPPFTAATGTGEQRATGSTGERPASDAAGERPAAGTAGAVVDAPPPAATGPVWGTTPASPTPPGPPVPPGPPAPAVPAWQPPPAVRRPRSPLGRITLGVALLAGGAVWMLDLLDVASVPASSILATVLVVLGLGLLVGSVVGRARWLALLVAVLLPVTAAAAMLEDLGIDARSGVGSRTVTVLDAADLADPIRYGAGELIVDLRDVEDPDGGVLDVSLGAGELQVWLPEGAGLTGVTQVGFGEHEVFGLSEIGVAIGNDYALPAQAGAPTFEVDLRVGAGVLIVVRDGEARFEGAETRSEDAEAELSSSALERRPLPFAAMTAPSAPLQEVRR